MLLQGFRGVRDRWPGTSYMPDSGGVRIAFGPNHPDPGWGAAGKTTCRTQ